MFRLAAIIYVLVASALAGILVTALLATQIYDGTKIASVAIAGAVLAVPAAWLIARQISATIRR